MINVMILKNGFGERGRVTGGNGRRMGAFPWPTEITQEWVLDFLSYWAGTVGTG